MTVQWLAAPGTDLVYAAERILAGRACHVDVFGFVLAILFPLLAVASMRWLEAGHSLYALIFVLAPLSRASPYLPLMNFSRYVLLLFPCFVVLALWGRHRAVHLGIILISLLLLLYWSAVFAYGVFVA